MVAITICKCNDIGYSYDYKSVHSFNLTIFMMTRVINQTTVVVDTVARC